jgi:hypothetical protein
MNDLKGASPTMTLKGRLLRLPAVLSLRTTINPPSYEQLPSHDLSASSNGTPYSDASPFGSPLLTPTSRRSPKARWKKITRRMSIKRIIAVICVIILLVILGVGGYKKRQQRLDEEAERERERNRPKYHWEAFER